jgi:hypothetical protein
MAIVQVLRHDKAILHPIRQKDHLKHVPEYLVPASMKSSLPSGAAANNRKNKKRKTTSSGGGASQDARVRKSKSNDPLLGGGGGGLGETSFADTVGDDDGGGGGDDDADNMRVFTNGELEGANVASGRQQWKQKHGKGKFNKKAGTKNSHRMPGSFIKSKAYK